MSSGAETTPLPAYVHAEQPVFYNVGAWLKENEEYFQPPVCNKMMHNYQLKVGARLRESKLYLDVILAGVLCGRAEGQREEGLPPGGGRGALLHATGRHVPQDPRGRQVQVAE